MHDMKHILVLLVVITAAHLGALAQSQRWLSYEPATVELEGRLVTRWKYGPPNYGEQPKTDEKVKVPILVLDYAVNVRGKAGDLINAESVEGVKQVQLGFAYGETAHKQLIGKDVVATGTLFHAHTGHHYTDVVLMVRSIETKATAIQKDRADATAQSKHDLCLDAVTQLEINLCAGKHFRESDKKLNDAYKRILIALKPADGANLVQAQRAWLKYRTANCWAERQFHGGSLAPTREAFCLRDLTEERIEELKRIYETNEEVGLVLFGSLDQKTGSPTRSPE
jgi:uncharacterized protein YecT (DUF1311 family)